MQQKIKILWVIFLFFTSSLLFCYGDLEEKVIKSFSGEGFGVLVRQKNTLIKSVISHEKGDYVEYEMVNKNGRIRILFKSERVQKKLELLLNGKKKVEIVCLFYESLKIISGEPKLGIGTNVKDINHLNRGHNWSYYRVAYLYDVAKEK